MAKTKHIHKYKKVNLARQPNEDYLVYKCTLPNCSHYVPMHLALGKLCICNRCDNLMTITKRILSGSHGGPYLFPHCPDCTEVKKDKTQNVTDITDFLSKNTL